jgi:predicted HTH transcriptional regulator
MARSAIESGAAECDFIEYMSSDGQKASILKTACAYANSYMRREIGLILIGVEEREDPSGGTVVPKRPVKGVDDAMVDRTKSSLRSLLAKVCPRIDYLLLDVEIDELLNKKFVMSI